MGRTTGRNVNSNDAALVKEGVELNNTNWVKIADANPKRLSFTAAILSNQEILVILAPVSAGHVAKGIPVARNFPYKMDTDNVYTGEISALAIVDSPVVYVTEY